MPWRETSPMEQRLEFVREYETELFTMTELAAQYGISRKTGYKWVERYDAEGADGLRDRSRRPHHSPQATDPDAGRGAGRAAPAPSALGREETARGRGAAASPRADVAGVDRPSATLLKQRGLVAPRAGAAPPARVPARRWRRSRAANEVWTTDFKGEFRTGDGVYCYPLTLRDGFSRFVLRCDALLGPHASTRRGGASSAPLPSTACPSGFAATTATPFAGPGLGGLSRLASGGCAWASSPSASRRAIPSRTGRMNNFMRC